MIILRPKKILIVASICLFVGYFVSTALSVRAHAASSTMLLTKEQLAEQVQEKAKQLDAINVQLQETQKNLKGTTQQRVTLTQQLSSINNNISQLNLNIQADQIKAQKLSLEIASLNYDIRDIKSSIEDKRAAIGKVIVELQKSDMFGGNLLILFLRNNTLADGVLEAQNLNDLQNQLTEEIGSLRDLHEQYNTQIRVADDKRTGVAVAQRDLENKKAIVQDQKASHRALLAETKNKESIFQQQLSALQKQQQQVANEIETLDAVLRTKIDPSELPPLGPGILAVPVQGGTVSSVTQRYGATEFAKNGYRGQWHNGIDFGVPVGTPILAAEEGTVVAVGNQDAYCRRGAYGKFVVINFNNNLTGLYAHLSRQIVQKGDAVKRGQIIGYSGMTGY
ncbi:MAG: peptidoglycan DD-metalloendopeptidase family protein, partial [Candidatus Liptonbacteria bacterium]|nr:peptidoglycan DD-metalloendopeptidase family protein [Candidatus Liptonbacteria bacterium]